MNYRLRIIVLMLFDALLVNLALYLSLYLRFDGDIPGTFYQSYLVLRPWFTITCLAFLYLFRIYHRMWQYASIGELYGTIKAVSGSVLIVLILIYTGLLPILPRSVYIFTWLLMIVSIGGARLGWRILRQIIMREAVKSAKTALIVGAGDAGAMVARELKNNSSMGLNPIGFVDDSATKQKLIMYGIPVLGTRVQIPELVTEYGIEDIIIAMPSAGGKTLRETMKICQQTQARLRIFSGSEDMLGDGRKIRNIELEDLLRREPVKLDLDEIASYLANKVVLISGAGGSIGSELCRQVCRTGPQKLILLDCSENNLFDIENELKDDFKELDLVTELTDIKDRVKLQQVYANHHPQVVFHAAAYKHVPMMEKHPGEAIKNNILGSKNMAELADKYEVDTFVMISTDKAVNPTNVMGASKRITEMLIQELNAKSKTKFAAVRFGNVLGSRGSVIPTFKKQIEKGGPVTVTHPDMTRYFMTIPEAVQLVIQAGAMATGGEIFVLDMGEPVKIIDLASDLIRLYNYEPNRDIDIKFTGIRPGEKLYEELFTAREQMAATRHERIFITRRTEDYIYEGIGDKVDKYFARNVFLNRNDAIELIAQILPEYRNCSKMEDQVEKRVYK